MSMRELHEQRLAAAMSRYIGYTTGAYDLHRIASIAGALSEKPFRYDVEIVQQVQQQHGVSGDYACGIIDFAVGLGFVQRLPSDGAYSRLVITDLGRTVHAAAHVNDQHLYRLALSFALLEYDADIYGLVLDFSERHGSSDWHDTFRNTVAELRHERFDWLQHAFPADVLVRRIAHHVRWLTVKPRSIKIAEVGEDFVRHHTSPRRGWARQIGHFDDADLLTQTGRALAQRVRAGRERYFWVGPEEETIRALRLDADSVPRPLGPAWSLLRPQGESKASPDTLIRELGEFMIKVYPCIRMQRTNQAPIPAVTPFLYLRESQLGYRTDETAVLASVFESFGDAIAPLSGKGRKFGHYQLRARA